MKVRYIYYQINCVSIQCYTSSNVNHKSNQTDSEVLE